MVEVDDLFPVRGGVRIGEAVQASDRRLDLIGADRPAPQHLVDDLGRFRNGGVIPPAAVLIGEQHQVSDRVEASITTGMGGQHQRQQPEALVFVRHQLDEEAAQPDRFLRQVDSRIQTSAGGVVPGGEGEVHNRQYRRKPVGQFVRLGDPVGDTRHCDLPFRPANALSHGRFRNQERPGDFGGGQPADRSQGERHPGRRRQRRVAAGEDKPQAVVTPGRTGRVGQHLECLGFLVGSACLPPEAVESFVSSHRRQPRRRVVRGARSVPLLEGDDDCVLEGVFGQTEVVGQPDEGGQYPATLDPDDLVDRHSPSDHSMIGRTSTLPCQAPGIWAAHWTASSRSAHLSK